MIWATPEPVEIPEITDEVRQRWHRLLDTTPTQASNAGCGVLIEELLGLEDGPYLKRKRPTE